MKLLVLLQLKLIYIYRFLHSFCDTSAAIIENIFFLNTHYILYLQFCRFVRPTNYCILFQKRPEKRISIWKFSAILHQNRSESFHILFVMLLQINLFSLLPLQLQQYPDFFYGRA